MQPRARASRALASPECAPPWLQTHQCSLNANISDNANTETLACSHRHVVSVVRRCRSRLRRRSPTWRHVVCQSKFLKECRTAQRRVFWLERAPFVMACMCVAACDDIHCESYRRSGIWPSSWLLSTCSTMHGARPASGELPSQAMLPMVLGAARDSTKCTHQSKT